MKGRIWLIFGLVVIGFGCGMPGLAQARDTRVALLVANQVGWQGDPKLHYVIKGDLLPLASRLQKLGFRIHALLLNRDASTLRRTLRQLLQRAKQHPRITTFFFYYSGHADKNYFHMGRRGPRPFSYQEFVLFLNKLRVKRRFGVIDACFSGEIIRRFGNLQQYRDLINKGILAKGVVRSLQTHDLSRHVQSAEERVQGLQVITSSNHLSFESRARRASVFTYHLLRGLKGKADINQDGKISFNELFLYVKPRVQGETGQSPQQWFFRMGGASYYFAPVYQSRLHIPSALTGPLSVRAGNFFWSHHKRARHPLHLAITSGFATVSWRRGQQCLQQKIQLPKDGEFQLSTQGAWTSTTCPASDTVSKGEVELPLLTYAPWQPERRWTLELQGGTWLANGVLQKPMDMVGGGSIGIRHRWWGLHLQLWGTTLSFTDGLYTQLGLELRPEAGYRGRWGRFDLFVGGYLSVGLLLQDINQKVRPSPYLHSGLTLTPSVWITERIALTLSWDGGIWPTYANGTWNVSLVTHVRLGIRLYWGTYGLAQTQILSSSD